MAQNCGPHKTENATANEGSFPHTENRMGIGRGRKQRVKGRETGIYSLCASFDFVYFAEVLSPHRPPAPPTEYFQFHVGGYDPVNLLRPNVDAPSLEGYIGCIRGLKIGAQLIDLAEINERNIAPSKYQSINQFSVPVSPQFAVSKTQKSRLMPFWGLRASNAATFCGLSRTCNLICMQFPLSAAPVCCWPCTRTRTRTRT